MKRSDAGREARSIVNQATISGMRLPVRRLLRSLSRQAVLYWPTPGNAGDALIDLGTRVALDRAGVRWRFAHPNEDVRGRTVLVGGGGNLVPLYDHAASAIDVFLTDGAGRIILLPHTIRGHAEIISRLRVQDLVLCRDEPSFQFARSAATRAEVGLTHDMALHLGRWDLRGLLSTESLAVAVDGRLANVGWSRNRIGAARVMRLLRQDVERSPEAPLGDLDPSALFLPAPGVLDQRLAAACLLDVVGCSRHVVTDRLHVAIAAVLLGVRVTFGPNTYGKNEDVFRHSLARLRGIDFRAWDPAMGVRP